MDYLANLINTFNTDEPVEATSYEGENAESCPNCGAANPPGEQLCGKCKHPLAALSQAAHEDEGDLVPIPDFYQPLFQACHAVATGQITPEEWTVEWEQVANRLFEIGQGVETNLAKLTQPPEDVQSAGAELQDGLSAAGEALDQMAQFLDEPNPEHLNQGWLALVRATCTIQSAAAKFAIFYTDSLQNPT